jgi:hypothetical protein
VLVLMSLGCLPAKGDSKNFSIERPVLLPSILSHGYGFGAFTHAKRALGSKVNGVQRV